MKHCFFLFLLVFSTLQLNAQIKLEGIMDAYLATDFLHSNKTQASEFVTNSELNQLKVNLGVVHFKANFGKWNVLLSPAFGTYMERNYATEKKYLRWIYEAQIGRVLNKKNDLTIGVFSSPYTQESAKSTDHIMYSRSLAPEYVPYYINGIRWRHKINDAQTISIYIMDGWQHIFDPKVRPALGSLYEYKKEKWYLNYSTFWGNQASWGNSSFQLRALNEVNAQFTFNDKWRIQPCVYLGFELNRGYWWQLNTALERKLSQKFFLNARAEYYVDPKQIQLTYLPSDSGVLGFSFGGKYIVSDAFWLRSEVKYLDQMNGNANGRALYFFLNTSFLF